MEIYKTQWFDRWARKQEIDDSVLCRAINEMTDGLYEADIGGHLLKKRIARSGAGKRGGFRTIVATSKLRKWFFVFAFAKNQQSDLSLDEERSLKSLATFLLSLSPTQTESLFPFRN